MMQSQSNNTNPKYDNGVKHVESWPLTSPDKITQCTYRGRVEAYHQDKEKYFNYELSLHFEPTTSKMIRNVNQSIHNIDHGLLCTLHTVLCGTDWFRTVTACVYQWSSVVIW